jgi:hypothetical protein
VTFWQLHRCDFPDKCTRILSRRGLRRAPSRFLVRKIKGEPPPQADPLPPQNAGRTSLPPKGTTATPATALLRSIFAKLSLVELSLVELSLIELKEPTVPERRLI